MPLPVRPKELGSPPPLLRSKEPVQLPFVRRKHAFVQQPKLLQPKQRVAPPVLESPVPPDTQPFLEHLRRNKVLRRQKVVPLE